MPNICQGMVLPIANEQRKPSITPTIGYKEYRWKAVLPSFSRIIVAGKTTGAAYINNGNVNDNANLKSRYWTDNAENQKPSPAEVMTTNNNGTTINTTCTVGI